MKGDTLRATANFPLNNFPVQKLTASPWGSVDFPANPADCRVAVSGNPISESRSSTCPISGSIKLGVKLVRGAYLEKETNRARRLGLPNPLQSSKEATDHDFDQAVQYCIEHIDDIAICCGSHNQTSTALLIRLMKEKGLAADDPRIEFAQLYGMSDHLTFNLAHHGFRVSKYLPYGPVDAVFPYLIRRAQENSSIRGQTHRELGLISQELKRRRKRSLNG